MKRALRALVVVFVVIPGVIPPARAAGPCHWISVQTIYHGVVAIASKKVCDAEGSPTHSASSLPSDGSATGAVCAGAAALLHTSPSTVCPKSQPNKAGGPGLAAIAAAVWRLPLPASGLHIQPVKGRTLVNLRTNFYATNAPIERTITLLGRRIHVRVWASRYAWRFGDGSRRSTTSAGAPYPNLLVNHRYLREEVVHPSLSTTYVAEYRIGQQAWRPVSGSASIPSPRQRLDVVTATPRLTNPYE